VDLKKRKIKFGSKLFEQAAEKRSRAVTALGMNFGTNVGRT
jgi:hypothetical protein